MSHNQGDGIQGYLEADQSNGDSTIRGEAHGKSIADEASPTHIDGLLKELKATQPTNNCYSKLIRPAMEEALIDAIETEAYGDKIIPVHQQNAGRLLFLIWKEASEYSKLSKTLPPMFGTLDQCNAYVSRNPNALALLAETSMGILRPPMVLPQAPGDQENTTLPFLL
ncbi:hypothetical protein M408DRAFT_22446 [Serendipita vermifera MAFF 305830]|uniref:Uncharacterized protein n=1 Tax=Serendipita vermifera MAFF 305830 TaxID=933852 RepID=A0A0C3BEY5_SERVB|nr:hypothetical protein M408DRAFT_22446 [Serendipita vermifera MAFF 305830]